MEKLYSGSGRLDSNTNKKIISIVIEEVSIYHWLAMQWMNSVPGAGLVMFILPGIIS